LSGNSEEKVDVGNPREVQGTLAIIAVLGFFVVSGAAAVAAIIRGQDPVPILNILAPLAFGVIAFYFGVKKSEQP